MLVQLWTWNDRFSYTKPRSLARWSTALVEQVVVAAGVPTDEVPMVVVRAVLTLDPSRHIRPLLQTAEMAGLPEYVRRHADAVRAAVPDLPLEARQGLVLVLAADPDLVRVFAPELAVLVAGGSKDVRLSLPWGSCRTHPPSCARRCSARP